MWLVQSQECVEGNDTSRWREFALDPGDNKKHMEIFNLNGEVIQSIFLGG